MADTTTYIRILGYLLTLAMHVGNLIYLNMTMKSEHLKDPQMLNFSQLQPRYFTVWTFFLQIIHALVGLFCEYLILSNSKTKPYRLPKHLKGFKDTLFSAILWPSTWVVFSIFWTLYLYDRELIYPAFVDKILTSTSNHIMHTAIVAVVFWEVCFQPRVEPRSHRRNIAHLIFHFMLYFVVLAYTYMERGVWLYPIFGVFYRTIYFPLLPIAVGFIAVTFYYIQWNLTNYFWSSLAKSKKIR